MYYVYTFSLYTCILSFSIKLHELTTTYRNFDFLNKERLYTQIQSFARSNADCSFFFKLIVKPLLQIEMFTECFAFPLTANAQDMYDGSAENAFSLAPVLTSFYCSFVEVYACFVTCSEFFR